MHQESNGLNPAADYPTSTDNQLELFQNDEQNRRKREQIDKERRRYSHLFNLAPIGFLSLNDSFHILDANIESALLLMIPRDNLAGEDFLRFVLPMDREVLQASRRNCRMGQKNSFELQLRTALDRQFTARLETILTKESRWLVTLADITGFKQAEQKLIQARDELQSVCERLREQRDQRFRGEEELRRFSQKLIETQENERRRIARELHEQIGQLITYLGFLLDKARSQLDPDLYNSAKSVAHEVLAQIRDLSSDLQPSMLRSVGLSASLKALFERFEAMAGIHINFYNSPDSANLTGEAALVCYRIVQEALTNVARHAQVQTASVYLSMQNGIIGMRIEDKGKGFDAGSRFESTGLTGMRERAQSVGGRLLIVSAPERGTIVKVELPLRELIPSVEK